ncbi:MAG: hypothetical protein WD512_07970, partial [Candidatus Paceibacterota bacterium]
EKLADKVLNTLETAGAIPAEGEFKTGMLFTDVNFAFNSVRRKFIAAGSLNMSLFQGVAINKKFTSTIALEKRRGGDRIYIYIVLDNGDWIYMEYTKGSISMASNNAELSAAISKAAEVQTDQEFFVRVATERMKDNFLKRNDIELDE